MLRFVASVMMVSGVLLISDAVITLAWQEPVSAYFSERQQVKLEKALIDPPKRVVQKEPLRGDALGKLLIPSIGVSEYVIEGTDADNLRKGPGHYPDTPLPGQHGTSAIAGHRTTYGAPFRKLNQLKKGDRIVAELPYGTFVYRVDRTQIVDDSALWVTKKVGHDQLVLTACHPLYSAAQRIVAFARLVDRRPATVRKA
ncbi:MAG: sortase [Thermoleophilaceae bacterium]|nr:sortase [Thermoleophilaceae bacterium]